MDEWMICNECDEEWIDMGDDKCPYCGSKNIDVIEYDNIIDE
jgi:Zn finger protein HypA/HybF involved in hydrogenase expression